LIFEKAYKVFGKILREKREEKERELEELKYQEQ